MSISSIDGDFPRVNDVNVAEGSNGGFLTYGPKLNLDHELVT